jgi:hypothetical protein
MTLTTTAKSLFILMIEKVDTDDDSRNLGTEIEGTNLKR